MAWAARSRAASSCLEAFLGFVVLLAFGDVPTTTALPDAGSYLVGGVDTRRSVRVGVWSVLVLMVAEVAEVFMVAEVAEVVVVVFLGVASFEKSKKRVCDAGGECFCVCCTCEVRRWVM